MFFPNINRSNAKGRMKISVILLFLLGLVSMGARLSTMDKGFNATANYTTISQAEVTGSDPRVALLEGECRIEEVHPGDSCGSLASRCGISGNDLAKYNPQKDLCSTLMPRQHVCCSPGNMPDFRPQPQADGTCYTYTINNGDGCWALGVTFYLQQEDIENFNKNTWGWAGCLNLQIGQVICLSRGTSYAFANPGYHLRSTGAGY